MANKSAPTTQTARAAAALNFLTHGHTSKTIFLSDEEPAEFFSMLENAFEHHQPTNTQDSGLVADIVLARWFFKRRQRIHMEFDAGWQEGKPTLGHRTGNCVNKFLSFDRYLAAASRALTRALNNARHIRKEAHSEQRWQAQHDLQKKRFALQRERFELAKQKEERIVARNLEKAVPVEKEPEVPFPTLMPIAFGDASEFQQTPYVGFEDTTVIYEVTPSKEKIRTGVSDEDRVSRVDDFVGCVPLVYKHLITPDAISWGDGTSVRKTYSAGE